jgi:hypothetical protein
MDRETVMARKRVQTAIMQGQEDMRNVEMVQSTSTKLKTPFEGMMNAIRESLSELADSNDDEDGEDEDDDEEDIELGNLSKDDEPG